MSLLRLLSAVRLVSPRIVALCELMEEEPQQWHVFHTLGGLSHLRYGDIYIGCHRKHIHIENSSGGRVLRLVWLEKQVLRRFIHRLVNRASQDTRKIA